VVGNGPDQRMSSNLLIVRVRVLISRPSPILTANGQKTVLAITPQIHFLQNFYNTCYPRLNGAGKVIFPLEIKWSVMTTLFAEAKDSLTRLCRLIHRG
jgi:hypothetical protein